MFNLQELFPVDARPARKVLVSLVALVAVSLPFKDRFLVNVFTVLALVVWLIDNPFRQKEAKLSLTIPFIAIFVFYFLHITAFLYTQNLQEGFTSLETKVSLLIFPLVFFTTPFARKQLDMFLRCFITGCAICSMLCLAHSTYLTLSTGKNFFFYQDISWFQHPSYLAMYLTFCCVVLFNDEFLSRIWWAVGLFFFTGMIFLLSSKSGIVIHVVVITFCFLSGLLKKGSYKKVLLYSLSVVLVLIVILSSVPQLQGRFQNVVDAMKAENIDKTTTESTAVRMLIWKEARNIVSEHALLGVGPGDANDELYARYKMAGMTGAYAKKLNAHSQYYQTAVGLGLVGLASFILVLVSPLFSDRRRLPVFFLAICVVNFLTESMLQTMAGCIFFGYFYAMLIVSRSKQITETQDLKL